MDKKTPKIPKYIAYFCVILASSLGFLIQPLMGKTLIPFFGGTPASWIGSLLFFQTSLLLGYLWAFWLLTKPIKTQVITTACLCLLAIISFNIPEALPHQTPSILGVIWTLSKSCLLACICIFSATLLISGWLSNQNQKIPYLVYAISNLGSLAGLLTYAFYLEPNSPIQTHSNIWYVLLIIYALLLCFLGTKAITSYPKKETKQQNINKEDNKPTIKELSWWILLSALACSIMIAATYLLAGEIGSNPISWVGPFGLYLLAFSICFTGKVKESYLPYITVVTLISFCMWVIAPPIVRGIGPALLVTLFGCCLIILTKLYISQPKDAYRHYLLSIAIGGSLGGLASSFLVPFIFKNPTEFFYLSLISITLGLFSITQKKWHAFAITISMALVPFLVHEHRARDGEFPIYERDIISSLKIDLDGPVLSISSQSTSHGAEYVKDSRLPTTYYSPHSPIGLYLRSQDKPLNVGVVGLSSGTLAAYAKEGDTYTFWDIDPKIPSIAQELFGFIKNSPGKTQIELGDGRLSLEASDEDFDVLVIDAYSGDAIPPHLITKEALEIYKKRLEKKNGVLFIHHSTRYSNYTPVLENTGRSVRMDSLTIITDPSAVDDYSQRTKYTVLAIGEDKKIKDLLGLKDEIHKIDVSRRAVDPIIWTDQLNSSLHTLEPSKILHHWKQL